jgi:DNA-binding XRE family transcriptional regulator
MRRKIKIPRILKIEHIVDFKIYVLFNNGETRLLDFAKILKNWDVQPSDIEYKLFDLKELAKVHLRNQTLSWDNIQTTLIDERGNKKLYPYEIGADVLFDLSIVSDLGIQGYGDMVKQARIKAGLTQNELANKSGTTRFYISRFENNKSDIELSTFRKIVEAGLGRKLSLQIK